MSDPYASLDYHALIDWPARLAREGGFLEEALAAAPVRRVLDLGCGPGEHLRWLVERGFEAVGVDVSEEQVIAARAAGLPAGATVVVGDLRRLEEVVAGPFGGAICLGNTLPHLREERELAEAISALRRLVAPGGVVVLQTLGYDAILDRGERALPVTVRRAGEAGEIAFVRLMTPRAAGRVDFFPVLLRLAPEEDPPVRLVTSRRVELRAWRRPELAAALAAAGFAEVESFAGFDGSPYLAGESRTLVMTGR